MKLALGPQQTVVRGDFRLLMNMDSSIDDLVETISVISWLFLVPTWFAVIGILTGLVLVIAGLIRRQKLKIDWFGLFASFVFFAVYLILPFGKRFNGEEALDVKRHGYFSVSDIYTWSVVVGVTFSLSVWYIFRLFKLRKNNFGLSLFLFSLMIWVAFLTGQVLSSKYGGAWTS